MIQVHGVQQELTVLPDIDTVLRRQQYRNGRADPPASETRRAVYPGAGAIARGQVVAV
jgi:hypothetical protein